MDSPCVTSIVGTFDKETVSILLKLSQEFVDTSIVHLILQVDLDLVPCGRGQGGDQQQEAGVEQGHGADL